MANPTWTEAERYEYFKKIGMEHGYHERKEEMEQDKAEREAELEEQEAMLRMERANLSPEEQKHVPKLDETNNLSYKYLRSKGNNWQYDPKKVHPKIRARLYRRFDTFDKDSDGTMTIAEVMTWAERMKSLCQSTEEEIESVRQALRTFFLNKGLTDEGCKRENWVECNRVFAEADRERERNGEQKLVNMLGDAYYNVLDQDHDSLVDLPELKRMMNIFRVPEEAAYTFFECADTNKNGQLERSEMHSMFTRFWMSDEYDPSLDGIFAYKY